MTGMRVMPMTTVSGPASRDEGVVMPWLMWCSGLAESSSPLMTATGPARRETHGPREAASATAQPHPRTLALFSPPYFPSGKIYWKNITKCLNSENHPLLLFQEREETTPSHHQNKSEPKGLRHTSFSLLPNRLVQNNKNRK